MALFTIKDLTFTYPNLDKPALRNINIEINEGDFIVLFGTTGSGKTTLLKLLKKEISPFGKVSGEILYQGESLSNLDDKQAAKEIGYVMQNPENQIVTDKVWHELAFGLENLGINTQVMRRRVGEMANFFGINDWYRKNTFDLSGGQKQLLNLASILVMQPKVLLLDEPTSQLDPIAASEFLKTLKKLNQELGLTIILVEHRLEEVFPIADKVMIMDEGKLVAFDEPKKIGKTFDHQKLNLALPSSILIYKGLNINSECPITVKEGQIFLRNHFKNEIKSLPKDKTNNPHQEKVITLKDIWFRYGKNEEDVLRGVNFDIYKGEIISLVGGNGSGKSTLLKVIAGLKKPYSGKIIINNKNIKDYKDNSLYLNNLAFLPQNPQDMFVENSVEEELKELLKIHKVNDQEANNRILDVIDSLELDNLLSKHPYDLSGGEQQKLALAKILLLKPQIILLDEPTKGLDAYLKMKVSNIIQELKSQNITVFIVTHDIEFTAKISDRCAMLFDGDILSIDTPTNFYCGNNFYTTAANRISRNMYNNTITEEEVIKLALLNGEICKK